MSHNPAQFETCLNDIRSALMGVQGWLTDREVEFLALAAAFPTASGEILELGSYQGKSTIVLAKAAQIADGAKLTTVDPMLQPQLHPNLQRAGVDKYVRTVTDTSTRLIESWSQPLRLFWLDGANDVETVTQDVVGFLPYLADGGVIAFHDILNTSGDRIHVFMNEVLASERFGATGICGTIGWAQYHADPSMTRSYGKQKQMLFSKLERLLPFYGAGCCRDIVSKTQYKIFRAMVPHGRVEADSWTRLVA